MQLGISGPAEEDGAAAAGLAHRLHRPLCAPWSIAAAGASAGAILPRQARRRATKHPRGLGMDRIFDKQITLLRKALDFRFLRQNMLAANVANVETPGYKAKDLIFEKALGEAMRAEEPGPLRVTNPRHFDGRKLTPLELVKPEVIRSANAVGSLDGNSVDLEREMAKVAENQMAYEVLTQILTSKFRGLRIAIREGEG
jgi:flagellar basal-body rod protein FlgB